MCKQELGGLKFPQILKCLSQGLSPCLYRLCHSACLRYARKLLVMPLHAKPPQFSGIKQQQFYYAQGFRKGTTGMACLCSRRFGALVQTWRLEMTPSEGSLPRLMVVATGCWQGPRPGLSTETYARFLHEDIPAMPVPQSECLDYQ